jgi:hypothetical protein
MRTVQLVKPVPIQIGDKQYELMLDFAAANDYETESGKSILALLAPIFKVIREIRESKTEGDVDPLQSGMDVIERLMQSEAISAKDINILFWACLGGKDSNMTVRQAGRLIGAGNFMAVLTSLWEAVQGTMPESDEDDEESETEEKDEGKNA